MRPRSRGRRRTALSRWPGEQGPRARGSCRVHGCLQAQRGTVRFLRAPAGLLSGGQLLWAPLDPLALPDPKPLRSCAGTSSWTLRETSTATCGAASRSCPAPRPLTSWSALGPRCACRWAGVEGWGGVASTAAGRWAAGAKLMCTLPCARALQPRVAAARHADCALKLNACRRTSRWCCCWAAAGALTPS